MRRGAGCSENGRRVVDALLSDGVKRFIIGFVTPYHTRKTAYVKNILYGARTGGDGDGYADSRGLFKGDDEKSQSSTTDVSDV